MNRRKPIKLILASFVCSIVIAEPDVSVETKHYSVYGSSAREVRNFMSARSPAMSNGKKYDGYTAWRLSWRYNYETREGLCYVDDAEVKVQVTITMPKLELTHTLSPQLRNDWDTYYDALLKHENGHRDHGVKAATVIEDAVENMPGEMTCDLMKRRANDRAYSILEKYKAREKQYDADTRHGYTQGAYFPRR